MVLALPVSDWETLTVSRSFPPALASSQAIPYIVQITLENFNPFVPIPANSCIFWNLPVFFNHPISCMMQIMY